jgi:GNAT superfamily N-acetyltransferase
MNVIVRPARMEDAAVIAEFNGKLASESEGKALDPKTVLAGVKALLGDSAKGRYFVATRDGQVVGQAAVSFEWSDWRNGWLWWLQSVYVHSEHRSQGIFRLIHAAIRDAAKAEHVVGLRLYVDGANSAGMAVYRSVGMQRTRYLIYEEMLQPV